MDTVVLSVGGSLIAPDGVDTKFVRQLVSLVRRHGDKRFVIVCGGGAPARQYQKAARDLAKPSAADLDWVGVMATRLNAELVRVAFGSLAHGTVVTDPSAPFTTRKRVVVAAGWKPGWSSDYDAVYICRKLKGDTVINLTNVDYVYDRDPQDPSAQRFERLSWKQFRRLVGKKWDPGRNVPFDPVASRLAAKGKLRVIIVNGKRIENLDSVLSGRPFVGTTLQ